MMAGDATTGTAILFLLFSAAVARFFNCLNSSEHPAAYLREGLPFYYEPARFARVLGDVPDADGNDWPVNLIMLPTVLTEALQMIDKRNSHKKQIEEASS